MKAATAVLALLLVGAPGSRAQEGGTDSQVGILCVAPVVDDGDPRGYVSRYFSVRVDQRDWIAVPADVPKLIPDLALRDKHLVRVRDREKTIESFWFRFGDPQSRALCLWYNSWYRTWSLWNVSDGGKKCRCDTVR